MTSFFPRRGYGTKIHTAIRNGQLELLKAYFDRNAESTSKAPDFLHHAATYGQVEIARLLLDRYGYHVDCYNRERQTPLHCACVKGHASMIRMLVNEHQADLTLLDENNDTPLHKAVLCGQTEAVNCIIGEFADKCSPNSLGSRGRTILHIACHQGNAELVEILLTQHGLTSQLLSTDDDGNIPLHCAALGGNKTILKSLITKYECPVECRNHRGQTPLHCACVKGHDKIVKLLVTTYEADVNARDENDCTPLHIAAQLGHRKVVLCMVNEFGCSLITRGNNGKNVLHYTCQYGHTRLFETLLLQCSPDWLSICDDDGNTPLHCAALGDNEQAVDSLVTKYNLSLNYENISKETPLDIACDKRHRKLVRLMVTKLKADLAHNALRVASKHVPTISVNRLIEALNNDPHIETIKFSYPPQTLRHREITDSSSTAAADSMHLLITKFDSKEMSIIRIFVIEYCTEFCLRKLTSDNIWYGNTQDVDFYLSFNGLATTELVDRTLLNIASQEGYLEVVKTILTQYSVDLSSADSDGNTPLHYAARGAREDIVQLYVGEYKCPVDVQNNNNQTPLHLACSTGHTSIIKSLLSATKHKRVLYEEGSDTPLHITALYGHTHVVGFLINSFSCDPNAKGCRDRTTLHHACQQRHIELAEELIKYYKADPLSVDDNGYTPLHLAALDRSVAKVLSTKYGHSAKGENGCSLLHLVCQQGDFKLVERLITGYHFDPMIRDDNGNTPLHYAALGGKIKVATLLTTKYGCPVNYVNSNSESPLHLACVNAHVAFIRTLVMKQKADVNTLDINSYTPLHKAVLSGQVQVVDCFIKEFKCSSDVTGTDGSNFLHLACRQGHLELVEHLVSVYNFDPMTGDENGNTPLHYAALGGSSEVATALISKYGSLVHHSNSSNETPLHLACIKGHLTFIRTLVRKHEADVNPQSDTSDPTPLQIAVLNGQTDVVCSLIREFNCDPMQTGAQERNILHYACLKDHDTLARKLIDSFQLSLISVDVNGNSPLHISAMFGQTKCVHMLLHDYNAPVYLRNNSGKSALDVARDVATKDIITNYLKKERNKLQYDYKRVQKLSKKKYSGPQSLLRVFVLGNVQSGKSTLIESLKRQGFFSSFNQVSEATVPPHTSGIIPSEYCHSRTVRVLYYDFAGDPEYYSSHSAIMSSVMQSKGTNICLVLINFRKDKQLILEELGYWFSFIAYHCVNLKEKCKVLTIGSHLDLITKDEATTKFAVISKFIESYLSHAPKVSIQLRSDRDFIVNCCSPRSSKCVYSTLNQMAKRAETVRLSGEAAILLGLLEKDFKNVVTCEIQTLLTHISDTGVYLPNTADSLYPKVLELHTVGFLMVIGSMSGKLEDYLLVLNVSKLTNEVHKLLFSKASGKKFLSSTDPRSASMGILPQAYLEDILPEYITTECLVQLQYCQEFSHAEVKLDYSVITNEDFCAPRLFYFPALCEAERKLSIQTPEDYNYNISWYVKCCGEFDYLPPRFLHVLLLRLAHNLALPTPSRAEIDAKISLYNRRCTMWKNGIHWLTKGGVEGFVEMVNNSRGIVVITKSQEVKKYCCTEMLFKIIREIRQAKQDFCESVTLQEYLMDSSDPTSFSDENQLFLISDPNFKEVLSEGNPQNEIVSVNGNKCLRAKTILHLAEYIHWGK